MGMTVDTSGETPYIGQRCMTEPDFVQQFMCKQLPLADGEVDVLTGATVTCEAIIDALNALVK